MGVIWMDGNRERLAEDNCFYGDFFSLVGALPSVTKARSRVNITLTFQSCLLHNKAASYFQVSAACVPHCVLGCL